MRTTRQMIREFSTAFNRPVNTECQKTLTDEDRILLGKLILEECLEYIHDGLGLDIHGMTFDGYGLIDHTDMDLNVNPYRSYDPIESADALGDMNVVIHFNAHWHGFNLDRVTEEIHRSNMSKLAEDGTPIINGVTPGYRGREEGFPAQAYEKGFDPAKPVGKILKGPNYFKPNLQPILDAGNQED